MPENEIKKPLQVGKLNSGNKDCTSIIQFDFEKVNDFTTEEKIKLVNAVKSDCDVNKDSAVIAVCDIALTALKLQTPQKAIDLGKKEINGMLFSIYQCPNCNKDYVGRLQNLCGNCGQALFYGVKKNEN